MNNTLRAVTCRWSPVVFALSMLIGGCSFGDDDSSDASDSGTQTATTRVEVIESMGQASRGGTSDSRLSLSTRTRTATPRAPRLSNRTPGSAPTVSFPPAW